MSYCIYLRKSRADSEAEARGEGETLARHEKALLELAEKRNYDIAKIHREIVSGESVASRPVMQQLLTEVERGMWQGVLVMEVERLARGDTVDQGMVAQTFKYSDTKIITPLKDYDPNDEFDEEYFEFGLYMSRREYKTINRRLQRGRIASVKEGKYLASVPPYGYRRKKLERDKGWTLEPNDEEADIVRMIFALYTKGEAAADGSVRRLGVSLIVRRLNDMHIKPRKSVHWSSATVRDMLRNPVYTGKIRWNWRKDRKKIVDGRRVTQRPRNPDGDIVTADGLHPALIDSETFALAQEYLSRNPPRPVAENKNIKNPLAGLVICAECGHKMIRRPCSAHTHRDTLICADTSCKNIGSDLELVESRIIEGLEDWLSDYRLDWKEQSAEKATMTEVKEKALQKLKIELETLRKQLDNTYDLLEQGVYTAEIFTERMQSLSERIKQNEEDQKKLAASIDTEKACVTAKRRPIPGVYKLTEVYELLPTARSKNDMLKEVLEKVVYFKTEKGTRNSPTDIFELTLYPKLPRLNKASAEACPAREKADI